MEHYHRFPPCALCGGRNERPESPWCSPACSMRARRGFAPVVEGSTSPLEGRMCEHCGRRIAYSVRLGARYCDHRCRAAAHRARTRQADEVTS